MISLSFTFHGMFLEWWNTTKSLSTIWQRFSSLLDEVIAKYARNWNVLEAFWATCKIGQPIQPIWQQFFALPWSALKKPSWELNFLHIFAVPLSSRHEKCCQILERLFVAYHHSRNILCGRDTPTAEINCLSRSLH